MTTKAAGLSARRVQTVKKSGHYADGGGLYLQVAATGAKTWIFRFQLKGRRRDMGLGSAAVFSLADARQKAVTARRLVAEGIDPIEERIAREAARRAAEEATKKAAITFRQYAHAFVDAQRAEWRNAKHASQWLSTLETYAYPVIGDLAVAMIDTALVRKVLDPIWSTKKETARRVRGRIEAILDSAKAEGVRVGDNPAAWAGNLKLVLPSKGKGTKARHHASLPYSEMPAFWLRLQAADGSGARALELAIVTAARTGEVLGARWPEVDLKARIWTIPAERMKAGAEHRVPLSDAAVLLLQKMAAIRTGELVFPGQGDNRPLSNMTMTATLRRMKVAVTPHGFRSTFRTWVAEKTMFPSNVAEAALAHTQGKLHATYQRGDLLEKRREMMAAWAAYCASPSSAPKDERKGNSRRKN